MPNCHICGKHHADLDSAGYCCYNVVKNQDNLHTQFNRLLNTMQGEHSNTLTYNQKYSIASLLATNNLEATIKRLQGYPEAIEFAHKIDKFYLKRDGFIPRQVLVIIKKV